MRYPSALAALVLLVAVAFAAAPALAQSVVINPNESYQTSFVQVDVTANATVTFELSYVDANNQTVPYLTLSGTSFSYSSSEPLLLTIKNTGTAAANVTFNTLSTDLAASGQATISGSDRVVRIPVATKAGDKITVTLKSISDAYARFAVVVAEYSDGTYERVDGGTSYYSVGYSSFFGSDPDWPSTMNGNYYRWVAGSETITFTASKDVSAIIVGITTFGGLKWSVTVEASAPSSTVTETTATTATATSGWLEAQIDLFGHRASAASVIVVFLFLLLIAAVLLRR